MLIVFLYLPYKYINTFLLRNSSFTYVNTYKKIIHIPTGKLYVKARYRKQNNCIHSTKMQYLPPNAVTSYTLYNCFIFVY